MIHKDRVKFDSLEQSDEFAHIKFSDRAAAKMFSLILFCDNREVGWHGTGQRLSENGEYLIDDIFLYPQRNTATTIKAEDDKYAEWQQNLILNGECEKLNRLCFHAHSHVDMPVYPSGVDKDLQEDIIEMLLEDKFYIFLIINRKMECYFNIVDMLTKKVYRKAKIDTDTGALLELANEYRDMVR